jgi:glycosyltransferase involved in cell wall biosynthesis
VDPAQFRPVDPAAVLARYGLAEPYLLFVGSLEPRKNLPALLSAWGEVRQRFSTAELVIAGGRSPVFRPALNGQGKILCHERVRFLGAVPDSELPALYSGAAALLLPSLYEGFGLPVMEAMACGVPVISSSAGALKEAAGAAALLIDPADAEGLAGAIERILTDEGLRADLRQKGFERSASFPWSRTADRTWTILQDEAESHG